MGINASAHEFYATRKHASSKIAIRRSQLREILQDDVFDELVDVETHMFSAECRSGGTGYRERQSDSS
jgi:hypothetical protein